MKKFKIIFLVLAILFRLSGEAQDSVEVKSNPIIFGEMLLGVVGGKAGGLSIGLAVHYQTNKSLLSFRASSNINSRIDIISPFIPFPIFKPKSILEEFAFLYGLRKTYASHSLSMSIGASYNNFREVAENINNYDYYENSSYWGLPFEASLKFFKKRKTKHRIYFLIPVGKPTSFGRSIGLKLLGSFSENSYGGVVLSYGLGLHKKY